MAEKRIGRQTPTQSFTLPYKETLANEAIDLYEMSGNAMYEWQKNILNDLMSVNEMSEWVHIQYGYSVPRQNGKNEIVFYDLDEQRVAEVENSEDPRMKEIADKIRSGSPTSLEWGTPGDGNPEHASYYYKEIKKYDESTAVFDRAFFGITDTGWVNLDLDIVSQKTYKIRGILSYNSDSLETSFFLRGLKHVWDTDGCKTELDFIR